MTIENRNLQAGTKLAARYRGKTHTVLVLKDDEGKLGFELDNGTIYKSLSTAGSAVMNGTACNGWRFWSLEDELPAPRSRHKDRKDTAHKQPRKAHATRQLRRLPNQKALAAGQSRWWCSACMASFIHEGSDDPCACPAGHPMDASDEAAMP